MRYTILFLFLLAVPVLAQTPGSCDLGEAEGDLDINDVFTRVFNTGSLFFGNSTTAGDGYLVPKASGKSPIFVAAFWVGGKVNGQIRVAGARYSRFEFWPGPLNTGATLPNPTGCSAYDRIFVVSREDVAQYLRTGEATDDLQDWPVDWGAPVLDGDGVEGNYNLEGGDQPAIYGDQMAWWVMNDVGNVHEETGSNPLGIEVQVSAFVLAGGSLFARQMTFYRYVLVNRSPNTIHSMYVTFFSDPDLGGATDDYAGSDTTFNMGIVYNGDNNDSVYGIPPALGFQFVHGPVGLVNGKDDDGDGVVDEPDERLGMTSSLQICSGCPQAATTDPRTREEYYYMMQGRWKDGEPITAAGYGYQTGGSETVIWMPGDPLNAECWSAENDCLGGQGVPTDVRIIVSTGPFQLDPGESEELVIALPFGQGVDRLDSVTKLRYAAEAAQNAWDFDFLAPHRVEADPVLSVAFGLRVAPPFPNPFTDQATVRYELPAAMVARMVVYDALGREVAVLVDGAQQAGSYEVVFDGTDLAPGTYVIQFEAAGEERAFTMIKLH